MTTGQTIETRDAGVTGDAPSAAQKGPDRDATPSRHSGAKIAIVGGGTAGVAVAAALRRRLPRHDRIVLIEPSAIHHYQPGFTLVGGGVWTRARTEADQSRVVPAGVTWVQDRVTAFDPDTSRLYLGDGSIVAYEYLVACPGLALQWHRVPGLAEALGDGRVVSIYSAEGAADTWQRTRALERGQALFTQPPMPVKCPGAPQKIVYMAGDYWRRRGRGSPIEQRFRTATPSLFSVPAYAPTLERVAARYGVDVGYATRLVAVDGPAALATFERAREDGTRERWQEGYDLLHAVPPQGPLDVVAESPLADAHGWIDVDAATLQHRRYRNVFGMGDASSVPTSKTAAAVRAQLPVVVANLEAVMDGDAPPLRYSGYASCPLITAYGKVVLAEFEYDKRVRPSVPWDSTRERRSAWWLKTRLLPWMYWQRLLKGRDLPVVQRH